MNITHAMPSSALQHQNTLLSAVLAGISDPIAGHLKLVELPAGTLLDNAELAGAYVYFPNDALISLLSVIGDGKSAEIGLVGSEGMVGIEGMIGGKNPYIQAKVQCAGTAFRVPNGLLKHAINRDADMHGLIMRYLHSMISQIGQAAICYRFHTVEQQLCRKLLMSSDRLCRDELALTQSTIAEHLGVRREGVTAAAGELRKLGVIAYRRGQIRILDRAELEERSCECWSVLRTQHQQFRPGELHSDPLRSRRSLRPDRSASLEAFASTRQAAGGRPAQARA